LHRWREDNRWRVIGCSLPLADSSCASSRHNQSLHLENLIMKQLRRFRAIFLPILLVLFVGGCAGTSKQESTGGYIDDTVLTTKVKAAVFNEPSLKSTEINVETFKGVVQLSGFVNSQADINKAVQITGKIPGVKSVKNDMRVK
jgi:hypothetical protein